jgi:predicted N-formylglutamate amidohydrolase
VDQGRRNLSPRSGLVLGDGDPPPFVVTNPDGSSPILLVGDHAGHAIPARLGDLGLSQTDRARHIAWDIGVAGLGQLLADRLDACFIRQTYSRLVFDCNRRFEDPTAIAEVSDLTPIPANQGLSLEDKQARLDEVYRPYEAAIAQILDARARAGRKTLLFSLHSFTPVYQGFVRPWRYGVIHRNDSPLSARVLALLQRQFGEAAGDNLPYAMDGTDNTVDVHALPRGLDYLELEVRQDLIADAVGQRAEAEIIAPLLQEALSATDTVAFQSGDLT